MLRIALWLPVIALISSPPAWAAEPKLEIRQLTTGPVHHFFGYIGHVQNIPWNQSGRYILSLRSSVRDHLPREDEPAEIVLLDTERDYAARVIERPAPGIRSRGRCSTGIRRSRRHSFSSTTGMRRRGMSLPCWVKSRARAAAGVREYRFADAPIGNSGVAQRGGRFYAINYGRLANLRAVTGYAGAFDGTKDVKHPANDGVFAVDVASGERKLLASFEQLAAQLRKDHPAVDEQALFINHTLSSRDDSRVFFFLRGGWDKGGTRVNIALVMNADGSRLRPLADFIGGHPEWLDGQRLIGSLGKRQVIYDTETMRVVGTIGDESQLPNPEGDVALSPDGKWFANGYRVGNENFYAVLRLDGGAFARSRGFDVKGWTQGDLRVDAAPCWNRRGDQILFSALADDADRTRQLFLMTIVP